MTNLPLTGKFNITAIFKQVNASLWKTLGFHTGIDFTGSDNIYATCDGIVDSINYSSAYGNYIIVKEDGAQRYHYFCHLSSTKIKKGAKVNRTTIIGIMGATGNVTGKHLHYEIRKQKTPLVESNLINPAEYCEIPNKVGSYNSENYQIKNKFIKYSVHIQNIGWQDERADGIIAGTTGEAKRIEAIKISASEHIRYRVHIQDIGWSEWQPNDCVAGTIGQSKRIEAIEIVTEGTPIKAQAHIEAEGWKDEIVGTSIMIGTTGKALRLEALKLEFV